ncbi:gamma-glutamyltranspeptidase/glutathione hydrolase [Ancylobacter sp. 3268]|uniref:gamma-glutamyltransferase n=1 Tax=Ancylobacter sp. 3268 TaxID=2817752 RepID=UPI00285A1CC7|nr:gamma-glutamyltransferase [Ancylobacter sp. 3268]MDR6954047.1 gamma-glutamyltranspeptidase/glutathione hydrolase [Ancylobacter sp. 3268]
MRDFEKPGRSRVVAREAMAATSHPSATLAAIRMLEAGGNALDAAIAACAVQCVVEPGSTGIGGDCFALLAGEDGRVHAYNGSGRTPAALTAAHLRAQGLAQIPRQSPHAVTVPGAVDAWTRLHADHGRLPFADLLSPAIHLAGQGYAVAERVHYDWGREAALLAGDANAARVFLPGGRPPAVGEVHRQPELAATLEILGREGRDGFYRGAVAQDIVTYLRGLGGLHTLEDFAEAAGEYVTPIHAGFRGHEVYECPPNGQGVIALMILNILARFPAAGDPLAADRLHVEIEATRLAYAARDRFLADPAQAGVPVDYLLSDALADELAGRIRLDRALAAMPAFAAGEHRDTVYICVVDRDGTCASFINSIFHPYGAGLLAPRSGVLLHNRGQSFVLEQGHPNELAPRKRPMHTIIPGMVLKDGKPVMPFGVMGGHYQAMGHAHFLSKVLDFGLGLQEAIDLPRLFPLPGTSSVEAEDTFPAATIAELRRRGFEIVPSGRPIGGAQAIRLDRANGTLTGASDPRKDGCALGV